MSFFKKHFFYGSPIYANREQEKIKKILAIFKKEPVNEELKEKIWNALQMAKHRGEINIPFKLALRHDPNGFNPSYIEIILDTKV